MSGTLPGMMRSISVCGIDIGCNTVSVLNGCEVTAVLVLSLSSGSKWRSGVRLWSHSVEHSAFKELAYVIEVLG